ncbi:hypothetical protein DRQ33_01985 [bacterium]|nr:MAG: hypothetical protein DRQ33_01985 [bacterium]
MLKEIWKILTIAFIIRLAIALFIPTVPISDCGWYNKTAISIARTGTFSIHNEPTAYRTPGYPAVLGIIYYIWGEKAIFGYILNAILGTLAILLLALILQKYTSGWKTVIWAFALFPEHILYTNTLATEILFQMLILLWLFLIIKRKNIFSAMVAGIMIYVRSVALFLPLLPIFWDRKHWKRYFAMWIIAMGLVAPWVIRNNIVMNSPTISTNFWVNLWIGNSSESYGGYFDPQHPDFSTEIEQEKWFRQKLLSDIMKNPFRPLLLLPLKFTYFTFPSITPAVWGLAGVAGKNTIRFVQVILTIINSLLIILVILILFRKKLPIPFMVIMIYFLGISLIFFGADRYRFPILPILLFIVFSSIKSDEPKE